jgi:hypothetical protein
MVADGSGTEDGALNLVSAEIPLTVRATMQNVLSLLELCHSSAPPNQEEWDQITRLGRRSQQELRFVLMWPPYSPSAMFWLGAEGE